MKHSATQGNPGSGYPLHLVNLLWNSLVEATLCILHKSKTWSAFPKKHVVQLMKGFQLMIEAAAQIENVSLKQLVQ